MKRIACLTAVVLLMSSLSLYAQLTAGPDNAPKVCDLAPDFQVSGGGRGATPTNSIDY